MLLVEREWNLIQGGMTAFSSNAQPTYLSRNWGVILSFLLWVLRTNRVGSDGIHGAPSSRVSQKLETGFSPFHMSSRTCKRYVALADKVLGRRSRSALFSLLRPLKILDSGRDRRCSKAEEGREKEPPGLEVTRVPGTSIHSFQQ